MLGLRFRIFALGGFLLTATAVAASPLAEHVFIISIDGGKPAVIARSDMPTLQQAAREGASTWSALTILPSLTLPSHTSMLTGVGPDRHHILWNAWQERKGVVKVPTIFAEAKAAGLSTAMFVGKEKFRHLVQPGSVDEFEFHECLTNAMDLRFSPAVKKKAPATIPARTVAAAAARYIKQSKPNLCFIHFTDADDAGHKHGWGSRQQLEALADVDAALAEVLQAIDTAGIRGQSVVLITADHGGHRKTHGSASPEDMHIPWIAWGAKVKENATIIGPVATYDTAATALWLLGVSHLEGLDGRPVAEAFATAGQRTMAGGGGANAVTSGTNRAD